jgi:hypothetical protein
MAGRSTQVKTKPASRSCPNVNEMLDETVQLDSTMQKLGLFLAELDKELSWYIGRELVGFNLTEKDGGWLVVLKVNGRQGREVAFVGGASIIDAYRNLWLSIHKDYLSFRPDKYK